MPVEFREYRLAAMKDTFTLEEAFTAYAAFVGILKTKFDSLLASASISVNKSLLSAGWYTDWLTATLPASFVVTYHKTQVQQAVSVKTDTHQWTVSTNSSGYPEIYQDGVLVQAIPIPTPVEADVKVAFRQIQQSDDETDLWVTLSLWMNDRWITAYTTRTGVSDSTCQLGFAGYGGATARTYTNIRIPELTDFTEYGTLDAGESAYGGLNRAIEGRYLHFLLRFDDSLYAWRTKAKASSVTLDDDYKITPLIDLSKMPTRVRMMGAYTWADAVDAELIAAYGDRFWQVDNPMLLTEEECADEAKRQLIRALEDAINSEQERPLLMFVEPEDRITDEKGTWLVTQIQLDDTPGEVTQQMLLRTYKWGEPT